MRPLKHTASRSMAIAIAAAAVAAASLAACSDGGAGGGGGGAGGGNSAALGQGGVPAAELPYAPCPESEAAGRFEIQLDDGFTSIVGNVSDGASPAPPPEELGRDGECTLLRDVVTTCRPQCPRSTEVCNGEGSCALLPRNRSVGTVTVQGLVIPLQMVPNGATRRYVNPAQPALPHPGFLPGADLRIITEGGDYAPFALRGWGVSGLVLGDLPTVAAGQPARLAWQPPDTPGPARVHVELNINHHGSTSAKIECDFADSGAAEIPAPLIDALIAQGVSGFPTIRIERRSATSEQIEPGCVDLLVLSGIESSVSVEGITSCNDETPCPLGQTCLPVEFFCE